MNQPKQEYKRKPFIFTGQAQMTSGSTGQISFSVPASWAFQMTRFTYVSSCNAANAIPTFDIQILNQDEQLFYDYVPNDMFAGLMYETSTAPDTRYQNAQTPWYTFPTPYVFPERANILVNLKNTSGQTNTVKIALDGNKLIKQ